MASSVSSLFHELIPLLYKLFQRTDKMNSLLNTFYEAYTALIPKHTNEDKVLQKRKNISQSLL